MFSLLGFSHLITKPLLVRRLVESLKLMTPPPLPTTSNDDDEEEAVHTSKRPDPRALGIPCSRGSLLSPPVECVRERHEQGSGHSTGRQQDLS
jgi:hypothetical protein